jgi:hypothetical protein
MPVSPSVTDIREFLEGYGITAPMLSDSWIESRRDGFVIPWVERKTNQSLASIKTITEYYSGNGTSILILNRRPILSVTQIEYVLGWVYQAFLNLNNIEVILSDGVLKAKTNISEAWSYPLFAKGDKNLKITYTYGFASIPADLKEAVIYLCCEQMLGFIGARTGGGSLNVQGFSRNYGERGKYQDIRNDLNRQAQAILSKYKSMVGGS